MTAAARPRAPWLTRLAWVPLLVLVPAMVALWVLDLPGGSAGWAANPTILWISAVLALGLVTVPAACSFLADSQPWMLMLVCSALVMVFGILGMAAGLRTGPDTAFAIYNTSVLLSAACHLAGAASIARQRMPLKRPGLWLALSAAASAAAMGLVLWLAFSGRMPVFFIDGKGGSLVRSLVLCAAIVMSILTAGLLWRANRQTASPFLSWIAHGLALRAAGLAGSLALTTLDSPLHQVTRSTQFLGLCYMCGAALTMVREGRGASRSLARLEALFRDAVLELLARRTALGVGLGYGAALVAVALGLGSRAALGSWAGAGLPPYLTLYPVVLLTAILAGAGPGLAATLLSGLAADYWILPRTGRSATSHADRLGLAIFLGMGLVISVLAEFYRLSRDKAAAYDRETAQREDQARLRVILGSIGEAVVSADASGRVTYLNQAATGLTGWRPAEALGQPLHAVVRIRAGQDQPVEALAAQVLRERRIIARSNPVVLVARDGREVPVEKNAAPVQDNAGLVIGIVLVLHDVTARLRMEQALRDEARRKDDFLALLGHELRNPLAPIGNAVFLLRRHGQDPNLANQACAIIERQAAHLAHLVDDLLDVSRLSRGKIQLKLEALDLVQVVREVLVDYQPSLTRKELALEADLPAGPVRVEADKARLTQTVGNLLHNAVKFTGEGGRIRMSVAAGQDGTGCVCVADTGPGIRPERLDSIFEPFTQDRDTIGRSQNGLGLGLALVKRLVELHGGRVAAHSEGLGHGARFEIRLPLLATAPPAAERPAARPAPRGRARRILIVEDLPDTAATLQLLLQTHGHAVATAADGDSALARAGSFEPEIVLCDIGLPGALDGHDVARALRRTPGLEKVHLIALTGFGAPEDKARAAQAGFDGHLTKPVQPEDLLALIAGIP